MYVSNVAKVYDVNMNADWTKFRKNCECISLWSASIMRKIQNLMVSSSNTLSDPYSQDCDEGNRLLIKQLDIQGQ